MTGHVACLRAFVPFPAIVPRNTAMLPNFLVIGAEKAGTTWLHKALGMHPEIFLPETKEIHFFNRYDSNLHVRDNYNKLGIAWYERFFANANQKAIGEITPMYLCDDAAPERIAATLKNPKLIISLREPGERAFSHFKMAKAKGHVEGSFEEAIEKEDARFLSRGLYGAQIGRYLKLFSREQIKIIFFEDIAEQPIGTLQDLSKFLMVDPAFYSDSLIIEAENTASGFASPWLYNNGVKLARSMRESKALWPIVSTLKRLGITDSVKSLNRRSEKSGPMLPGTREYLTRYFAKDLESLETLAALPLARWRTA